MRTERELQIEKLKRGIAKNKAAMKDLGERITHHRNELQILEERGRSFLRSNEELISEWMKLTQNQDEDSKAS